MRLDVALFELRLFKSRSQATAAIQDGVVQLNGEVVKPSHGVKAGDRVTFAIGETSRTVEVLDLPRSSVSRAAAQALVRDVSS